MAVERVREFLVAGFGLLRWPWRGCEVERKLKLGVEEWRWEFDTICNENGG